MQGNPATQQRKKDVHKGGLKYSVSRSYMTHASTTQIDQVSENMPFNLLSNYLTTNIPWVGSWSAPGTHHRNSPPCAVLHGRLPCPRVGVGWAQRGDSLCGGEEAGHSSFGDVAVTGSPGQASPTHGPCPCEADCYCSPSPSSIPGCILSSQNHAPSQWACSACHVPSASVISALSPLLSYVGTVPGRAEPPEAPDGACRPFILPLGGQPRVARAVHAHIYAMHSSEKRLLLQGPGNLGWTIL